MDKYDFNVKVSKLKEAIQAEDWDNAFAIAEKVDWRKINSVSLLSQVSEVYEKAGDFKEAKEILMIAFELAPNGRRLLYKLTTLSIATGEIEDAENFYRDFTEAAPDDPRQNILRYLILKEKNSPLPLLINSLEQYNRLELNEKWLYELAELYHMAGRSEECIKTCDQIMLMFGIGQYVDKAIDLKKNKEGAELTDYQQSLIDNREKYEERLRGYRERDDVPAPAPVERDNGEVSFKPDDKVNYKADNEVHFSADEMTGAEMDEVAKLKESVAAIGLVKSEHASDTESTKVFKDIKHSDPIPVIIATPASVHPQPVNVEAPAQPETQETETEVQAEPVQEVAEPAAEETAQETAAVEESSGNQDTAEARDTIICDFVVERRNAQDGLKRAIEIVKLIHSHNGSTNQVAKIRAEKFNAVNVQAMKDKLAGRDIIIEEAGDLTGNAMYELIKLIKEDTSGRVVILIDNPMQIDELLNKRPELTEIFCFDSEEAEEEVAEPAEPEIIPQAVAKQEAPEPKAVVQPEPKEEPAGEPVYEVPKMRKNDTSEEMSIDEFAEYCHQYAKSIDCVITGKSKLALYERIELMEEDGTPLTRNNAAALIEEAADRAEHPTFGQRISGLFSARYDKEENLILKESHFIY